MQPDPDRPGASRCDQHPRLVLLNEHQAAAHLRDEHPQLWDRLAGIEIVPLDQLDHRTRRQIAKDRRHAR